MGFELESIKSISGEWNTTARSCDACNSVPAAIFCRVDSAFLCITCDTRIHSFTRHDRVCICQVCEQAPAAVTCKADAAALCVKCDSNIHSANPLASRHERVPVEPFFNETAAAKFQDSNFGVFISSSTVPVMDPWLVSNDFKIGNEMKSSEFLFSNFDGFIDFDDSNSFDYPPPRNSAGGDRLVPVPTKTEPLCFDIDFCRSKLSTFTYPTQSITQNVSNSSLEYGLVPDGNNSISEISIPVNLNRSTIIDSKDDQTSFMDREARVLRYREKRKNRKFVKTIRYASRKAYAESRPRIKGRFVKRTENENDDVYTLGAQYGVVPTF